MLGILISGGLIVSMIGIVTYVHTHPFTQEEIERMDAEKSQRNGDFPACTVWPW
jgi:hypothetical protein